MWIAIQHLYGIYTDFKKTINPIQYYDNGNDDYDCDDSVASARMADRPPVSLRQVHVKFTDLLSRFRLITQVNVKTMNWIQFKLHHHACQLIRKTYSAKVMLPIDWFIYICRKVSFLSTLSKVAIWVSPLSRRMSSPITRTLNSHLMNPLMSQCIAIHSPRDVDWSGLSAVVEQTPSQIITRPKSIDPIWASWHWQQVSHRRHMNMILSRSTCRWEFMMMWTKTSSTRRQNWPIWNWSIEY